jgi:hypothetical protein
MNQWAEDKADELRSRHHEMVEGGHTLAPSRLSTKALLLAFISVPVILASLYRGGNLDRGFVMTTDKAYECIVCRKRLATNPIPLHVNADQVRRAGSGGFGVPRWMGLETMASFHFWSFRLQVERWRPSVAATELILGR